MNEKGEPKPPDVEMLFKQAIAESPALQRLVETVRYGELLLTFQNKQITGGYVKQTVRV